MQKPFKKVVVVGTGILGTQIAMLAANVGYKVKVYDPREGLLSLLSTTAKRSSRVRSTPFIPWDRWQRIRKAVVQVTDLGEAVKDADFVIEAAPENVELKNKVFKQLGAMTPKNCILATNSSSIPVSKMEKSSGRPEHCLNVHFYFPLQGTNMVDIMGGTKTLPAVIKKGREWDHIHWLHSAHGQQRNPRVLFQPRLARHQA